MSPLFMWSTGNLMSMLWARGRQVSWPKCDNEKGRSPWVIQWFLLTMIGFLLPWYHNSKRAQFQCIVPDLCLKSTIWFNRCFQDQFLGVPEPTLQESQGRSPSPLSWVSWLILFPHGNGSRYPHHECMNCSFSGSRDGTRAFFFTLFRSCVIWQP